MNKLALLAFSLLMFGPAFGADIAEAPVFQPKVWAAPVIQSFVQLGTDRLNALGVGPLTELSKLVVAGVGNDQEAVFTRLSRALATAGQKPLTAEAFAALTAEKKLEALTAAGISAQAEVDAEADRALAAQPEKLSDKNVSSAEGELAPVAADRAYLSAGRREKVDAAAARIAAFKVARHEAFETWLAETPQKIYDGAFDGAAHIAKGEDGWRIGEHAPTQDAYQTYQAGFDARLSEIKAMPEGPWKARALDELIRNADAPSVVEQAKAEGADVEALKRTAVELRADDDLFIPTNDKKVDRALSDFIDYDTSMNPSRPGTKAALVLLKHYDNITMRMEPSLQTRWRIDATLVKGDGEYGYQPYDDLVAARKDGIAAAHRNALRSLFVYIPALIGGAVASSLHAPWFVTGALFALVFVALAIFSLNIWRRDTWGIDYGYANYRLDDFKAKIKKSS